MVEKSITVFIVEDDLLVATAIEYAVLSANRKVIIHKFTSIERALGNNFLQPNIIFTDHYLERINGVDSLPVVIKVFPKALIAVVSSQKDIKVLSEAYEFGAATYIMKDKKVISNIIQIIKDYTFPKEVSFLEKIKLPTKRLKGKKIRTVAVIENDKLSAFAIEYPLRNKKSIHFVHYVSVDQFLTSPISESPDIVVLDCFLEDKIVSTEDVDNVKRKHPKAKLLMLSSNQEVSVAVKLIESGIDYYMNKSKENIERLSVLLDQRITT